MSINGKPATPNFDTLQRKARSGANRPMVIVLPRDITSKAGAK